MRPHAKLEARTKKKRGLYILFQMFTALKSEIMRKKTQLVASCMIHAKLEAVTKK